MLNHKPTLIFISNPFGYGPTATLIPIIKEFESRTRLPLIFIGSSLCLELIGDPKNKWKRLKIVKGDERDIEFIKSAYSKIDNPYVISSLNRFAIPISKQLQIHNALIDPLGWFWKDRPVGFDTAEAYFYNNFGQSLRFNNKFSFEIPLVISNNNEDMVTDDSILFNIGGAQNPLVTGIQENYLILLLKVLKELDRDIQSKIVVVGGKRATAFLSEHANRYGCKCLIKNVDYFSFSKLIRSACAVITPAGMNAAFSAFYLEKPTIIYFPQNLSQIELGKLITNKQVTPFVFNWEDYIDKQNWGILSEKESIGLIDNLASRILNNKKAFNKLSKDVKYSFNAVMNLNQKPDVTSFDFGGERIVFEKLVKIWFLKDFLLDK